MKTALLTVINVWNRLKLSTVFLYSILQNFVLHAGYREGCNMQHAIHSSQENFYAALTEAVRFQGKRGFGFLGGTCFNEVCHLLIHTYLSFCTFPSLVGLSVMEIRFPPYISSERSWVLSMRYRKNTDRADAKMFAMAICICWCLYDWCSFFDSSMERYVCTIYLKCVHKDRFLECTVRYIFNSWMIKVIAIFVNPARIDKHRRCSFILKCEETKG